MSVFLSLHQEIPGIQTGAVKLIFKWIFLFDLMSNEKNAVELMKDGFQHHIAQATNSKLRVLYETRTGNPLPGPFVSGYMSVSKFFCIAHCLR